MLLAIPMRGIDFNTCSKFSLLVLYSNDQINIGWYIRFWLSKVKCCLDFFNKEFLEKTCKDLDTPLFIEDTNIKEIVFDVEFIENKEENNIIINAIKIFLPCVA